MLNATVTSREESTCHQQLEWGCPRSSGASNGAAPAPHSLCNIRFPFPFCKMRIKPS